MKTAQGVLVLLLLLAYLSEHSAYGQQLEEEANGQQLEKEANGQQLEKEVNGQQLEEEAVNKTSPPVRTEGDDEQGKSPAASHGRTPKRKRDILIMMDPAVEQISCNRPYRNCRTNCPRNRCACFGLDPIPPSCFSNQGGR